MGADLRALGAVDELTRQTVYRARVMAKAHTDGEAEGLAGPALTQFVDQRTQTAFGP